MGARSRAVTILLNTGADYIGYPMTAFVTRYMESDLVAGGSIQLGDLRVMVMAEDLAAVGITKLEQKDRINIDQRAYSVVHYDQYTRAIGPDDIAVEIAVRGGGSAVIASQFVYRITGDTDRRITGDGDFRGIREAI